MLLQASAANVGSGPRTRPPSPSLTDKARTAAGQQVGATAHIARPVRNTDASFLTSHRADVAYAAPLRCRRTHESAHNLPQSSLCLSHCGSVSLSGASALAGIAARQTSHVCLRLCASNMTAPRAACTKVAHKGATAMRCCVAVACRLRCIPGDIHTRLHPRVTGNSFHVYHRSRTLCECLLG